MPKIHLECLCGWGTYQTQKLIDHLKETHGYDYKEYGERKEDAKR